MTTALPEQKVSSPAALKPGWIGITAIYLVYAAVILRTLGIEDMGTLLTRYLILEVVFIILYTLVLWKVTLPHWLMHLYFLVQSALTIWLLSLWPDFDFVVVFFMMLSYQVSLVFSGKIRWIWIGILVSCLGGSLIFYFGVLHGLALSLTSITGAIVIPAYISANHEIEQARAQSQLILVDLQVAHQHLQEYTVQVDELATIQERNRLARELHDTVSQLVFSISLTTRSAQLLLDKDPARLGGQLQRLREITTNALAQLRSLITQLRPPQGT